MPKFRPYSSNDLPKVLEFVGRCFLDNGLSHCHPGDILHWMSSEYRARGLEEHFWLYEEQGELMAFAEFTKAEWGQFTLITDPKRCDRSLERALLLECQSVMQDRMSQNPPDNRVLSAHVSASDQQRLDLLRDLGYRLEPSKRVVTLRSLALPIPTPVLPDGFHIRSVESENEADRAAEVHNGSFGPKWTEALYLEVMRTPGFVLEHERVVIAPDGRFAAFLIYWLDPVSRTGLFEPVGCHKDFQRRGLTKALMYDGMARMVEAGMTQAIVEHYNDNPSAAALYASVGFREHFKTFDCERPME